MSGRIGSAVLAAFVKHPSFLERCRVMSSILDRVLHSLATHLSHMTRVSRHVGLTLRPHARRGHHVLSVHSHLRSHFDGTSPSTNLNYSLALIAATRAWASAEAVALTFETSASTE